MRKLAASRYRGPRFFALLAAMAKGWVLPASAHADSSCQLQQNASLDIMTRPDGAIAVPVTLNGYKGYAGIDTGSGASSVTMEAANGLSLHTRRFAGELVAPNGTVANLAAPIESFSVGPLTGKQLTFFVFPEGRAEPDILGFLGADIMHNYDIDIDFVNGKFNLISPDHCPGQVVYWTKSAYAQVLMKIDKSGHIVVPAILDGKAVTVIFDTGSYRSTMTVEWARELFGWDKDKPPYKTLPGVRINNGAPVPIFQYAFNSLAFEGVQINHPDIIMVPRANFISRGSDDVQIILGMNVIRQLHVYIAYKENTLYLTPAEAR